MALLVHSHKASGRTWIQIQVYLVAREEDSAAFLGFMLNFFKLIFMVKKYLYGKI